MVSGTPRADGFIINYAVSAICLAMIAHGVLLGNIVKQMLFSLLWKYSWLWCYVVNISRFWFEWLNLKIVK